MGLNNCLENGGRIASRTGQWAGAIECGRKRDDTGVADVTASGLEADDATERSGNANGTSGVCSNAAVAKAGGKGSGRTSAGAAGDAREIPGISDRAEVGIVGRHPVGELMHVRLAKKDSAGFFQENNDLGVVLWNEVFQDF